MNNISNLLLVQFWSLETSSRPSYDFQKIIWGQFIFSLWLTTLITTVHTFKRTKNLTLSVPILDEKKKNNLNFYFHISLWSVKRFYEGLKGL